MKTMKQSRRNTDSAPDRRGGADAAAMTLMRLLKDKTMAEVEDEAEATLGITTCHSDTCGQVTVPE